ncbi:MAG: class I SAM-dependent methyltransferase [Leptospiraceae bacterium]|nr:class I SAM-dependent methyltransferase [Leptospiraceae bacterium]MCP5503114.1 class I SAM-dependent methyltransferase [Leptospiraceae bacterium]
MPNQNNFFSFIPHPRFPEEYEICQKTGACRYLKARSREYSDTYFSEEYKNQYKKTYYEDESALRKLAQRRLAILSNFINPEGKSLLEIGCAAGFFLHEAQKTGFKTTGIELSQTETAYARNLGLNIFCTSYLDFESPELYHVICAFFVLEHFDRQQEVLEKMVGSLEKGGFIFLALPSLKGPTYTTNPEEWFKTHPEDHFIDYSPDSIRKVFLAYGMELVYKEPMSYHPARDKGVRGMFPLKHFYRQLAGWDCYGDTMQVLFRKNK